MRGVPSTEGKLAVAGLVLCAAIVVVFLLSIRWRYGYAGRAAAFTFAHGAVTFVAPGAPRPRGTGFWASSVSPSVSGWAKVIYTGYVKAIHIPLWMPFLPIAAASLLAWRRARMRRPGHCRNCGYDLMGNVSGVCPECGKEVQSS